MNNSEMNNKVENYITRGQILWVSLPAQEGARSVQQGRRPVVVISNNKGNMYSPVILVCPVTSRKKKLLPTHVDINASTMNGLACDSTILTEQLFTIDKGAILGSWGRIDDKDMKAIDSALRISLAL